ncbi:MAG: hypothetical protein AAGF74_10325 [Pseudomonadota bacterium]
MALGYERESGGRQRGAAHLRAFVRLETAGGGTEEFGHNDRPEDIEARIGERVGACNRREVELRHSAKVPKGAAPLAWDGASELVRALAVLTGAEAVITFLDIARTNDATTLQIVPATPDAPPLSP